MYDCIKDFASPVATLIAAIVASVITYTFAQAQTRLAQSQRDIALDKLKFGLFQKRYEIYEVTKELLEYVPFINSLENLDASKVRSNAPRQTGGRRHFQGGTINQRVLPEL